MAKRKEKPTGLENTEMGTEQEITLGPASTRENPSGLPPESESTDEQPLMGNESGETWEYQADPQVREVLKETERQDHGSDKTAEARRLHNSVSPILTGGDVDAAWQYANSAGEEAVGGTVPTPDQDRVDELGEAAGLVYQDEEPLNTQGKLEKRDRQRWELNPASQE
jgi:hypothetical protein